MPFQTCRFVFPKNSQPRPINQIGCATVVNMCDVSVDFTVSLSPLARVRESLHSTKYLTLATSGECADERVRASELTCRKDRDGLDLRACKGTP